MPSDITFERNRIILPTKKPNAEPRFEGGPVGLRLVKSPNPFNSIEVSLEGDTYHLNKVDLIYWLNVEESPDKIANYLKATPEMRGALLSRHVDTISPPPPEENPPQAEPVALDPPEQEPAEVVETPATVTTRPYSRRAQVAVAILVTSVVLGALAVYLDPTLIFEPEVVPEPPPPPPITSVFEVGSWEDAERYWYGD